MLERSPIVRSVKGREAPVRFGYGSGVERFERFRFSVPAVPLQTRFFFVFQYSFTGKDGSGSGPGSWKTIPAVPLSVSGKRFRRFRFPVPVWFLSHPEKVQLTPQQMAAQRAAQEAAAQQAAALAAAQEAQAAQAYFVVQLIAVLVGSIAKP